MQATDDEVWAVGAAIAGGQGKTLYGRAVLAVSECLLRNLGVVAAPVEGNPNHADIVGWPSAKQDQKAVALLLAAAAKFVSLPA